MSDNTKLLSDMLICFLCHCQIPTEDTLEHFVCSALSNMSEAGADSQDNEGGCIPAWLEAKLYLVCSVNKIKLYTQVCFNRSIARIHNFAVYSWSVTNNYVIKTYEWGQAILQLVKYSADKKAGDILL